MKRNILLLVTIMLLIPTLSWSTTEKTGPYFSGFVGVTMPKDTTASGTAFDTAGAFSFADQVEFDPGINIGGTAGYDFGYVRLEGEMSYKYSEMKSITASDGFRFGNVDGNIGAFAIMGNAFFDLHNTSTITPYIGGGIGFASLHLSDTYGTETTSAGTSRPLLYGEDDDTVFAYQAGAGVGIALNRRLTLDIGYRYFGTSRGQFGQGYDPTTEMKFESHNAAVGLRVKF